MRVFMTVLRFDVGLDRAQELAQKATDIAATYPGEPSSGAWFRAFAEVLEKEGTITEAMHATHALAQIKKLYDAGY